MAPVATDKPAQGNDGRSKDRMTNYTKFWEGDLKQNADVHNENRLSSYTELVNGEYGRLLQFSLCAQVFAT